MRYFVPTVTISRFSSVYDAAPARETIAWSDFTALFSDPRRAACSRETCLGSICPHKRGPCWSPATYAGVEGRRGDVDTISLLAFDIERASDDQLFEIRARLGGHRYLIHATHSDRSDRPGSRFVRIIVPLSRPVSRAAWPVFWRTAQQALAPIADPACSDAGRIYFLPSCPHDVGYFVQVNDGAPLDVPAILALAPVPSSVDHAGGIAEGEVSP